MTSEPDYSLRHDRSHASAAIRGHGGEVREVIYDADHADASERAYAPGSELYDWFAGTAAGASAGASSSM
jgi:hypothetical protein